MKRNSEAVIAKQFLGSSTLHVCLTDSALHSVGAELIAHASADQIEWDHKNASSHAENSLNCQNLLLCLEASAMSSYVTSSGESDVSDKGRQERGGGNSC